MTLLVTDPLYLEHSAPDHVECPDRVRAILRHLETRGLLRRLVPLPARDATVEEIESCHDRALVDAVRETSNRGGGWFDSDTYVNARSYAAAVRAVGGVLAACEALDAGKDRTAFCAVRPPGHHATPSTAMGFCLFNSVAIAARRLRRRVLIVDWDVHHGNGTQDIFWNDPSVWYFSTHRRPFYPGTGGEEERGAGNIHNVPLSEFTPREAFLGRFKAGIERARSEFKPEFVLVSCGFDAYAGDPIGGLGLRPADYRTMTDAVLSLGVPVASALEGGYSLDGLGPCAEEHLEGLMA